MNRNCINMISGDFPIYGNKGASPLFDVATHWHETYARMAKKVALTESKGGQD